MGFQTLIEDLKVVRWLLRRADPGVQLFASRATYIGVLVGGALLALSVSGLHVTALAALIGASEVVLKQLAKKPEA